MGAVLALAVAIPIIRSTAPAAPIVERRLSERISSTRQGAASVVSIAARARPWVVNINVKGNSGLLGQIRGTGSGVILRSDGHILTNDHVVSIAEEIEVTLASGEKLNAKLVGKDEDTDVAVIKIDKKDLPAAVVGSARDLQVGEIAVAIGSPLGLEQTVTAGIISAVGRTVDRGDQGEPPLVDMIQTDAAVTQGNSGGALVNGDGALIGINSAIATSPDVGAEGIAFAIPIDIAVAIAQELIQTGKATHPWLGVTGGDITPETAEEYGVDQGAYVIEVLPDSPAADAGIKQKDVVVSFDGERIDSMDELVVAIREHKVGERVAMEIVREGKRLDVTVTLGDKPGNL